MVIFKFKILSVSNGRLCRYILAGLFIVISVYVLLVHQFGIMRSNVLLNDEFMLNDEAYKKHHEKFKFLSNGTSQYKAGPKNKEQRAIVKAFSHAWRGYKLFAWGRDELKPVTKGWINWMAMGLTMVDSLDTLYIFGLDEEFRIARNWIADNLVFNKDTNPSLFEIVIRVLGGLLSAYHLSGDEIFLEKAPDSIFYFQIVNTLNPNWISSYLEPPSPPLMFTLGNTTHDISHVWLTFGESQKKSLICIPSEEDLGNKLYPCLTNYIVPCRNIGLKDNKLHYNRHFPAAELGTLQLELRDLSRSLGNKKFEKVSWDISIYLHKLEKLDGLVSALIDTVTNDFVPESSVTLGGMADSYYEYLLKQWIQTGKTVDWLKNDYLEAIEGVKKHLLKYTEPNRFAFVGSLDSASSESVQPSMEHLACFLPGTLALGVIHGLDHTHLDLAADLMKTCYLMYHQSLTGLSSDVTDFNLDPKNTKDIIPRASSNMQRPETVESLFYLFRATSDKKYREWGWKIFLAFNRHTKVPGGYAGLLDVNARYVQHIDKMESFFLSETLKYLFLLFSDDPGLFPLDRWVFNTEAHPLPIHVL